jgi:dTDP-4-amino-4,6-dideoxygalactose transaminase
MTEKVKPSMTLGPVPPVRIDFSEEDREWIAERIKEVLTTGRLTLGPYGEAFESRFAEFVGAKHAVAISNGTAALEIILRGLGVAGRDVLVPANTFFATAAAVLAAGGRPVLMDTDPRTLSTSAAEIERRLTTDTAAVVIVHIGGFVTAEMPAIGDLLARKGVWLVEDAAHAHGSLLNGKHAGTFGIAGSFSFYPTKVMTSAEGGMIVTNDDRLAAEARLYRDQGKASFSENSHIRMGNNWRLSEPHAIIGLRHLENLAAMVQSRRAIGARYADALLKRDLGLASLDVPSGCAPNYYKYIVRLSKAPDRPALKRWLRSEHQIILAGEVYETPLQLSPVFRELDTGDLEGSRAACAQHLCLPMFASMTEQEIGRVVTALEAARSAGHI